MSERDEARTRKAFARRQWRRRWRVWRFVVLALVLVLLAGGAAWALWRSDLLSVQGVEVTGNKMVTDEQVRRAADVPLHGPLVSVDLDAVTTRVEAIAEVRSVNVSRQWPDQVRIDVTEREPLAVVEIGDRIRALDIEGVLFWDFKHTPRSLPLVRTPPGTETAALREGAEVVDSLPPSVARLVEAVEVETVDRIRLALRDGREVVWGNADDSEQKAEVLTALLKQPAQVYDVSAPGQPTTSGTP